MLTIVRFWILLSTLLVSAGWILSALHQLNRIGYGVGVALGGIAIVCWWRRSGWRPQKNPAQLYLKFRRRFKHPAPLIFLALALMSLAAGLLYPPFNADSNAYRIPRVWHWLGDGQWHWIHTADARMNIVDCGYEWLCAPLMLFTRTDRLIFLINWASYLMLPGLIFSVFTGMQVRPRVAWWWMWLLASGWCFVLQAGSVANDAFAAVYALAAVALALRAREKKSATDFWLSLLAAALLTGAKQSNMPLALPWLVATWPCRHLFWTRPLGTLLAAATGLLVSAVPVTALNFLHAGNWQGLSEGTAHSNWSEGSPAWKFIGNVFCIPEQNLLPPYFPWSGAWNGMVERFVATPFGSHFAPFEHFAHLYAGISEGSAGIGLGLSLFTVVTLLAAGNQRPPPKANAIQSQQNYFCWLRLAPWVALLAFMVGMCSSADARMLSAYYGLLFPLLLTGWGQGHLVRQQWWQRLGLLVMLLAVAVLMTSRSRPLFPAVMLSEKLKAAHPQSKFLNRLWLSYAWLESIEQQRNYFQKDLPPEEKIVGYATVSGGAEMGLWLPFGQRRVMRVLAEDTPAQLRAQAIHYVLVEDVALDAAHTTIEEWRRRYDASPVDQLEFFEDPHRPPGHLYLVRLNQPQIQ